MVTNTTATLIYRGATAGDKDTYTVYVGHDRKQALNAYSEATGEKITKAPTSWNRQHIGYARDIRQLSPSGDALTLFDDVPVTIIKKASKAVIICQDDATDGWAVETPVAVYIGTTYDEAIRLYAESHGNAEVKGTGARFRVGTDPLTRHRAPYILR